MAFAVHFISESGDNYLYAFDGLPTFEEISQNSDGLGRVCIFLISLITDVDSNRTQEYENEMIRFISNAIENKIKEIENEYN